jgi:hypothetical protein
MLFYREQIITLPRKETKRESRREAKAQTAAAIEKVIVNPNVTMHIKLYVVFAFLIVAFEYYLGY